MLQNAIRIIGGVMAVLLLGLAVSPVLAAESERRLVLGRISSEPRKHFGRLQAMADYLSARLAGDGIAGIDVRIVETPERMLALLHEGKVDLFSETVFTALDLMADGAARPLLREWKSGAGEYHTVILARRDGDVKTLSDLPGHRFAFEDPGSTSGYLIPRVALETDGLRLVELPNPRDGVPDGAVGFSFAGGEINVVAWVNRGLADAGAISNLDWADPNTAPAELRNELVVIHETAPVIRSLFMVRRAIDDALAGRISEILTAMHETAEGRTALKKYAKVARYDALQGDALKGLDAARSIRRHLNGG